MLSTYEDLRKMNGVMIDKAAKTATAQGGCLAKDVEAPAEAEGLSVVFGAVNVTGNRRNQFPDNKC